TLMHDEGWQFMQLGKYLERADKTLRILDNQYHLLRDLTNPADLPLSNLQWAAVLRSCLAFHAYQRLYVGPVQRQPAVWCLLLRPAFPRSVRFGLEASARALASIEGPAARGESRADRVLGRLLGDLKFAEIDEILRGDLHLFLGDLQERCARVSTAVQDQYALV